MEMLSLMILSWLGSRGAEAESHLGCLSKALLSSSPSNLLGFVFGSSDADNPLAKCTSTPSPSTSNDYSFVSRNFNELGADGSAFRGVQRIYQGSNARVWPHHVGLCLDGEVICGGSLVDERWVVTAAHCLEALQGRLTPAELRRRGVRLLMGARLLRVSVDSADPKHYQSCQSPTREPEQLRDAVEVIVHPHYGDPLPGSNDIALLRLASPVRLSTHVRPIKLQLSVEPFLPGEECWVMGWGVTEGFAESSVLREAEIKIRPHPECLSTYGVKRIDHSMFCAGEVEGVGANTCRGDSGGSLVCGRRGEWILAGVTSFGDPCGTRAAPGVYANMDRLVGFVAQAIEPSKFALRRLEVISGRKGQPLACPPDFQRVPQNLRAVAGSRSRVFICYSREGEGAAVTALRVIFSYRQEPTCPMGWLDLGLSEPGARRSRGAPRLKLCYSRREVDGRGHVVTDIISIMRYWRYEKENDPAGFKLLQPPIAFDLKKMIFLAYQTKPRRRF